MAKKKDYSVVTVVDQDDLDKLAKKLNKSKLLPEPLEFEEDAEFGANVEAFLDAVESVPEKDEDDIPKEAADAYNEIVDEIEGGQKDDKKESKKGKKDKEEEEEEEEPKKGKKSKKDDDDDDEEDDKKSSKKKGKKEEKEEPKKSKKAKKEEEEEDGEDEKPSKKKEKGKAGKTEGKSSGGSGLYREGTSAFLIYEAVKEEGKEGMTPEECFKALKKKLTDSSNPEGRVKLVLRSMVKRGLATKKEDRYFVVKGK